MKRTHVAAKCIAVTLVLTIIAVPAFGASAGLAQVNNFYALGEMAGEQAVTPLSNDELDAVEGSGIFTETALLLLLADRIAFANPGFGVLGGLANLIGYFAILMALQTPFKPCGAVNGHSC